MRRAYSLFGSSNWRRIFCILAVLLLTVLLYLAGIAAMILGGIFGFDKGQGWGVALFVVGIVWVGVGWFPALGLKVLKPQEALVLTLFGKYIGTLKEEGFYFVNEGLDPSTSPYGLRSG